MSLHENKELPLITLSVIENNKSINPQKVSYTPQEFNQLLQTHSQEIIENKSKLFAIIPYTFDGNGRRFSNAISMNAISLDFDINPEIESILEKCKFTYFAYTTYSHHLDFKNNVNKLRVIIPFKESIPKVEIDSVLRGLKHYFKSIFIDNNAIDESCFNRVQLAYFPSQNPLSNSNTKVWFNESDYLDAISFKIEKELKELKENTTLDTVNNSWSVTDKDKTIELLIAHVGSLNYHKKLLWCYAFYASNIFDMFDWYKFCNVVQSTDSNNSASYFWDKACKNTNTNIHSGLILKTLNKLSKVQKKEIGFINHNNVKQSFNIIEEFNKGKEPLKGYLPTAIAINEEIDFNKNKFILMNMIMSGRKTTRLHDYLETVINFPSVIVLPCISLIDNQIKLLQDRGLSVVRYDDNEEDNATLAFKNMNVGEIFVTTIHSFHKIIDEINYKHIVTFDEIQQIHDIILTGELFKQNRPLFLEKFKSMNARCHKVIFADAYVKQYTFDLLNSLGELQSYSSSVTTKDGQFSPFKSHTQFLETLKNNFIKKGERFVYVSDSLSDTNAVYKMILKEGKYKKEEILLVNSETKYNETVSYYLMNPNMMKKRGIKVLIYSPVIVSGFSIDKFFDDNDDKAIFANCCNVVAYTEFLQMLARVRDGNHIHMHCSNFKAGGFPAIINPSDRRHLIKDSMSVTYASLDELQNGKKGELIHYSFTKATQDFYTSQGEALYESAVDMALGIAFFAREIGSWGYTLNNTYDSETFTDTTIKNDLKEIIKQDADDKIEKIINAPDISNEEADVLKNISSKSTLNSEQYCNLTKHHIKSFLGKDTNEELVKDDILLYQDKNFRQTIKFIENNEYPLQHLAKLDKEDLDSGNAHLAIRTASLKLKELFFDKIKLIQDDILQNVLNLYNKPEILSLINIVTNSKREPLDINNKKLTKILNNVLRLNGFKICNKRSRSKDKFITEYYLEFKDIDVDYILKKREQLRSDKICAGKIYNNIQNQFFNNAYAHKIEKESNIIKSSDSKKNNNIDIQFINNAYCHCLDKFVTNQSNEIKVEHLVDLTNNISNDIWDKLKTNTLCFIPKHNLSNLCIS